MQPSGQTQSTNSYYSLKELVNWTGSYLSEFKLRWKTLVLALILGCALGVIIKLNREKTYEAEVSFMLNEETGSFGGVSSVIGQFGGLLSSGDQVNLHKILDLAKSRKIAEKIFFKKISLDGGHSDYLVNHLIREQESIGKWAPSPFYKSNHPLKGFKFQRDHLASFERIENMALLQAHQLFLSKILTRVSDKTNLMYLNMSGSDETLTFELATNLFGELSQFYIDKSVEKQEDTYRGLLQKTDSLKALLDINQHRLAGLKDNFRGSWLLTEDVPKTLLDQDIKILQLVYAEAMKNKEMASFALINKTPFIQPVDLPILPLKCNQTSWPVALLMGMIYGLFAGFLYIGFLKFFRDSGIFE
ncbi:MAG: hypothetical protein IPM34_02360 [Saprospiraceae bacterium]|nr:hypothetical protein [Saprospiraceae bacterium]